MITDKFKRIIFDKLTSDLSEVDIIFHNDSLWFINREKKYWYLELEKSGKLYWRWQFFTNFFSPFTMERDEYEPLIKEWVESVLNCGVKITHSIANSSIGRVESVLNCGVKTTSNRIHNLMHLVESVLNCGVKTTIKSLPPNYQQVVSVLNCGVTTTTISNHLPGKKTIESVLNDGVTIITNSLAQKSCEVESVLNNR